jgi:hypothetical protein
MIFSSTKVAAATMVACLMATGAANAAVSFTYSPFGAAGVPKSEQIAVDFDGPNAPGFSYTQSSGATQIFSPNSPSFETGVYNDSPGILIPDVAAAPALGNGLYDQTNFEAVLTGGNFDLATPGVENLSVYIGSADSYNQITFENKSGTVIQSYSGSQIMQPDDGDQAAGSTNGRVDFNFGGQRVYNVIFGSGGNSFEFDNIAAGVPEPSTWAMMLIGLGCLGVAMRSSRRKEVALAA